MKRDDCIFCKLANGDIPTNTLYENEKFRVILDASPAVKGHALVLPKDHFANIYEIDEQTAGEAAAVAKKMAKKISDTLHCDGLNILQNNGEAAGQTVFHYHIHLIPRYQGDEDKIQITWKQNSFSDEEMQEIKDQLSL
jgi:histidine triad (HIT) family protein